MRFALWKRSKGSKCYGAIGSTRKARGNNEESMFAQEKLSKKYHVNFSLFTSRKILLPFHGHLCIFEYVVKCVILVFDVKLLLPANSFHCANDCG